MPNYNLQALGPEELGSVILELAPRIMQNGMFGIADIVAPLYPSPGHGYPPNSQRAVILVVAEALSWLTTQGLVMRDPQQPADLYVPTRRARDLKTRADVDGFRRGRVLPIDLLQPMLAEKVQSLFLRGDHDIAVFQAFKEVEVAVRKAANTKGAGYADDLVGVKLMRSAFHTEDGPLRNSSLVVAEREAESALFAGAIGHAKNPTGHRDVDLPPLEAARLVVFASHLLSIVEQRSS